MLGRVEARNATPMPTMGTVDGATFHVRGRRVSLPQRDVQANDSNRQEGMVSSVEIATMQA